jgi:phage shock protein C
MITTAIWPVVLIYFGAALFLKPEPVIPFASESDNEFYGSYTNSRSMALHRLKKKFDQLQNRLHRMEDVVTSREFSWDMKMGEK